MTDPLRIYVAGPYTADPQACTDAAIEVGKKILDAGHAPFVPHLFHYWETLHGARPYEDWMLVDLAWLRAAHALLRMPGKSSGADREVALAKQLGIPVFYTFEDLKGSCFRDTPDTTAESVMNWSDVTTQSSTWWDDLPERERTLTAHGEYMRFFVGTPDMPLDCYREVDRYTYQSLWERSAKSSERVFRELPYGLHVRDGDLFSGYLTLNGKTVAESEEEENSS